MIPKFLKPKIISLLILTLLIFQPLTPISAQATTVTTTYPFKYYNIDSNGKVTKHIFANGVEIATIEGTGSEAKVKYIHTDNLGSTNVVTDETGAVVETVDYFPYGNIRIDQKENAFSEQRKFIGQEYDADTKLNYLNARYYDSSQGKFLSQDPAFLVTGDDEKLKSITKQELSSYLSNPQQLNSYSYAENNPINKKDPEGKQAETLTVGIAGATFFPEVVIPAVVIGGVAWVGWKIGEFIGKGIGNIINYSNKSTPKAPDVFLPPTHKPAPMPTPKEFEKMFPGQGITGRLMPPTVQYPDGYWVPENKYGQPVEPSTGKPPSDAKTKEEARSRTHNPNPPASSSPTTSKPKLKSN